MFLKLQLNVVHTVYQVIEIAYIRRDGILLHRVTSLLHASPKFLLVKILPTGSREFYGNGLLFVFEKIRHFSEELFVHLIRVYYKSRSHWFYNIVTLRLVNG